MNRSEEKIAKYIREHIREFREARGISQEELAEVIDRNKSTISDIERGKVGVNSVHLGLIAKKLGKPVQAFYPLSIRGVTKRGDLGSREHDLVTNFQKIMMYPELESALLDFVARLASFSNKSEFRRTIDSTVDLTKTLLNKD